MIKQLFGIMAAIAVTVCIMSAISTVSLEAVVAIIILTLGIFVVYIIVNWRHE